MPKSLKMIILRQRRNMKGRFLHRKAIEDYKF